jgi:hypothetical protein
MEMPEARDHAQTNGEAGLSYKFQRLREKLRHAVTTGELTGKLLGERALAKKFHVNAKTLSKALTDLAAEGLLDRSIGRGTFVKGSAEAPVAGRKWLIVCDPENVGSDLVRRLQASGTDCDVVSEVASLRPSFLNQISGVVDVACQTSEEFVRDLIVRNLPVVRVGKEPAKYSTHAVLFDTPLAVSQIGRSLLLDGHRKIAAVEPRFSTTIASTLRGIASRIAPDAMIDACFPQDVGAMTETGVSAFVCHSIESAAKVREQLAKFGLSVPGNVSVAAIGSTADDQPFTGYFVHRSEEVASIVQLLLEPTTSRPTTLWLAGKFVDRATTGPADPHTAMLRTNMSMGVAI